jgi:hypothetical protein
MTALVGEDAEPIEASGMLGIELQRAAEGALRLGQSTLIVVCETQAEELVGRRDGMTGSRRALRSASASLLAVHQRARLFD